jgi:hypothetical protein
MLRSVAVVRADVSEERIASIIRVTGIGELVTTLAVTAKRRAVLRTVHDSLPPESALNLQISSKLARQANNCSFLFELQLLAVISTII